MIDEPSGRKHPIHQPVQERFNTPIIVFVTVCAKNKKRIFANEQAHHVCAMPGTLRIPGWSAVT
jgi:hypothetical protein